MHFLGELCSTLVNFLTIEIFGFLNPVTLVYQVFTGFLFYISLSDIITRRSLTKLFTSSINIVAVHPLIDKRKKPK